jgi:FkbM family methyltransferase
MAIISYAQNYEDVLLNRLFPDRSSGFYIDVGAWHPVIDSVTKLFYERGWRGINIEPIPSLHEKLTHDRTRDINLQLGVSNCEGVSAFYECSTEFGFSTFSDEQAEILREQGHQLVRHSVAVTTLARVCEQYAADTIDFLKIDVESHERQVLEGADWKRFRPRVVLVEATEPSTNIPSYEHWEPLLFAADYLFAFFDGLNRYYVRSEDQQLIPTLAVPANVFDRFEIYDYQHRIQGLHRELERLQGFRRQIETNLHTVQTSLTETSRALNDSHAVLSEIRTQLDATQTQLQTTQTRLGSTQTQLQSTQAQLQSTQAELESSRAQLAPFRELGPIAVALARRVRLASTRAPRLAKMAKRIIRRTRMHA